MMNADAFLRDFFGTGNGIVWEKIPKDLEGWLQPWIERVRQRRYPIILPRLTPGRQMLWYAAAASATSGFELAELITAFVGHSYAEFSGRVAHLQSGDPVDHAVEQYLGDVVYQFSIPNRKDAPAIREALDRLRSLLDSRPVDSRRLPRPAGRILRDFEFALLAGDDHLSGQLIDELRSNGHLSTANISFLEVVRLADLGDWVGVLSHTNIPRLVEMRRPIRVTLALVEAVYRRHFLEADQRGDPASAVKTMRETVLPRYGPLYQATPAAGKYCVRSLLLVCLATEGPPPNGAGQLLSVPEAREDPFAAALADELQRKLGPSGESATDPLALARGAIEEGRAQLAMGLLADAPPSGERAILMLQSAYELGSLDHANMALEALDDLSPESRAALPQSRYFQSLVAYVRDLVGADGSLVPSPNSWVEWFERVASDPDSHSDALRWAQLGADEWALSEFEDEAALRAMTKSLGNGTDEVVAIHRDALPYFLRGFAHLETASIRPLKLKVLETLLYRGTHSRAELDTLLDVLEMTVPEMDTSTYLQVLQDFTDVWLAVQSPASLDWAIQALDILAYQPCRDASARSGFAIAVFASANSHQRRVQLPMRLTLNDIGRDLGVPQEMLLQLAGADAVRADPLEALRGLRVALYTLTETAGLRARDLLTAWTKGRVDLLGDKVCSDALRVAARESDIFVMVTRSAKHAATDCIKANRPEGKPLIITTGKGSTSVLFAVRQFLVGAEEAVA